MQLPSLQEILNHLFLFLNLRLRSREDFAAGVSFFSSLHCGRIFCSCPTCTSAVGRKGAGWPRHLFIKIEILKATTGTDMRLHAAGTDQRKPLNELSFPLCFVLCDSSRSHLLRSSHGCFFLYFVFWVMVLHCMTLHDSTPQTRCKPCDR